MLWSVGYQVIKKELNTVILLNEQNIDSNILKFYP